MSLVQQNQIDLIERRIASLENMMGGVGYAMKSVAHQELVANSKSVEQSEMQFGMYTALCVDTIDIWKQNRIRFFCPLFHNPNDTVTKMPWACAVSSLGGFDDCGATWVPPAGSTVCIVFENGNRSSPYYIGTTWQRNRGSEGAPHNWGYNIDEYYKIWEGKRNGYLVGPDDGSQVLPPWNTENYNGYDLSSLVDFDYNPEAQKLITYPNIFGFKTPEKHYIKMVDGDPKCNRKWKRFEIMSSCGNWIMLKDDHLHYSGQWAHPSCGGKNLFEGETSCVEGASNASQVDLLRGGFAVEGLALQQIGSQQVLTSADAQQEANTTDTTPKFGVTSESDNCEGNRSNKKIIGGHPSTGSPVTRYYKSQIGTNPFFKHRQECRPYRGAPTPQNNVCDLPQSGIQIMSISGHTFVMDDSVEEPSNSPTWDREFDFGCNDHYVGRSYWKSATGHLIEMSDVESPVGDDGAKLRGPNNYIKILTATGNLLELNDHTESQKDCPGCPPNIAGSQRGIHLRSTSNHTIDMVDEANEQCAPCRTEGGVADNKAKKAFVKIRTGYGLEMSFNDDFSQQKTDQQSIQIFCPQKDNVVRGPHLHRFQEAPSGPGLVILRAAGNYIVSTYDNHITVVGDEEKNPSNLIEVVTNANIVYTKGPYINKTENNHYFVSNNTIWLLAGEDCPDTQTGKLNPCYGRVLVYDEATGTIKISSRVFASLSSSSDPIVSIFQLLPFVKVLGGKRVQ
jgi:Type VI secretion system/phage-baseplate injector OB domain